MDPNIISSLQSQIQSNKSYKKTQVSGWRIYTNGIIYEQNKRSGEIIKQHRVVENALSSDNTVVEYIKVDEDTSTIASIVKPNMEEEYERSIYTCGESGINELEWWFEHSNLSKNVMVSCIMRKPVQFNKLWKQLQLFGLATDN
jgi:hypothetical protein